MARSLPMLLCFLAIKFASSEDNVIAVTANSTVSIKCPISDKIVAWDIKPYGQSTLRHVHDGQRFLDDFNSPRFSFDSSSQPGRCNLQIHAVELNDAGNYTCRDISDAPEVWSTDLVVTDPLECKEEVSTDMYIGENEFSLAQTATTFTCSLLYRGKSHLALKMTLNGKEYQWARVETDEYDFSEDFQRIIYAELRPVSTTKSMAGGIFVCEAIIKNSESGQYHNTSNVRWQSDPLDIKFAKLENRPVAECPRVASSLNCNPPCTYEQKQHSDGTYYCQSNYTLQGQTYTQEVISYFNEYASNSGAETYYTMLAAAVFIILVVNYQLRVVHF